ncbi:uncharacterized protein LOC115881889 isoform X2 [Sitophilus oryzae]|uniref:Uncharacterized protein LOC115881889 isoform X2 n=1 Tax=Sitophilus oryzae TaxID=7048 RepID=A0A6J2XVB0_SITOR|nr:uncharacterized protein LOC115881889 isoform X2 [Sitophilus oryzae]
MPARAAFLVNVPGAGWTYKLIVGLVLLEVGSWWWSVVSADCWYDNQRHLEGSEVATSEPCLNCTCTRNILLCYLRVCPKLPDPPPPGCILLHRHRTCCQELICSDFYDGGNSLESRSEPEHPLELFPEETPSYGNGCISDGSIYAPGSAMHSSSLCEYCYCLAGKQICVKPKCLMQMKGCVPEYEDTSCCPVRYNCTTKIDEIRETTTPVTGSDKGGCLIDGLYYPEGVKVIGIGHSVCDNCYCVQGILRCEPLSCAPPLLGCTPVIRPGECCAASYNCNGTLEIEAEPNYGLFPTISKEYSKFRKEVQKRPIQTRNGVVTVAPLYALSDSWLDPTTKIISQRSPGTTRHFSTSNMMLSSTAKPLKERSSDSDISAEDDEQMNDTRKTTFGLNKTDITKMQNDSSTLSIQNKEDSVDDNSYLDLDKLNILSIVDTLLDTTVHKIEEDKNSELQNNTQLNVTDLHLIEGNSIEIAHTDPVTETEITETTSTTIHSLETTTNTEAYDETTTTFVDSTTSAELVTVRTVIKSTDCIDNTEDVLDSETVGDVTTTIKPNDDNEISLSESQTETTTTSEPLTTEYKAYPTAEIINNYSIVNNVNSVLGYPDISGKNNNTKEENLDYDYTEPTLPNVKIIPFVAADALDKDDAPEHPSPVYINEKIDHDGFTYNTNLFSPPTKTEGGFVPKEPPILQSFYDDTFPSRKKIPTDANVNCILDNQEITHGTPVLSDSACMTCSCFYGSVVCQKPNCPPPRPGCREAEKLSATLCCPNYICDESVVLDRYDIIPDLVTVAEGIIPSDPFNDVIRTEPAPDLQSLMGDMMSLQKISSASPIEQEIFTTTPGPDTEKLKEDGDFFELDKIWKLIFSKESKESNPKNSEEASNITSNKINPVKSYNTLETHEKINNLTHVRTETPTDFNNETDLLNQNEINNEKDASNGENMTNLQKTGGNVNSNIGVDILKLAGCNIYGRMYRVGRIISELSGPCLECKCTEIGVQCRQLSC